MHNWDNSAIILIIFNYLNYFLLYYVHFHHILNTFKTFKTTIMCIILTIILIICLKSVSILFWRFTIIRLMYVIVIMLFFIWILLYAFVSDDDLCYPLLLEDAPGSRTPPTPPVESSHILWRWAGSIRISWHSSVHV